MRDAAGRWCAFGAATALAALLTGAVALAQSGASDEPLTASARAALERYRERGRALFQSSSPPLSRNRKACASCHPGATPIAGCLLHFPRYDAHQRRFVTIDDQIATCVVRRLEGDVPGHRDVKAIMVYLKELH